MRRLSTRIVRGFSSTLQSRSPPNHTVFTPAQKTIPSSTADLTRHDAATATGQRPDPYKFLAPHLSHISASLLKLVGSSHPSLTSIAEYYFLHPSKQLRPLLILLFSQATNGLGRDWPLKLWAAECEGAGGRAEELDKPLTRPDVLTDWNPNMPENTASFSSVFTVKPPIPSTVPTPPTFPADHVPTLITPSVILPTQLRLAQIVEMIHVASLLHDDVIDKSPLRRGAPSAPATFGNKLTILAGDFLLGRASAALSRLGDSEVVELIASVVSNLAEGEMLQMEEVVNPSSEFGDDLLSKYLNKTYLKTATLMAKGARASVILGGCQEGEIWKEIAYAYARNLGIAFQVWIPMVVYRGSLLRIDPFFLFLFLPFNPQIF
jgi:hexaprenyl-diphosphate synthase